MDGHSGEIAAGLIALKGEDGYRGRWSMQWESIPERHFLILFAIEKMATGIRKSIHVPARAGIKIDRLGETNW